MELFRKKIEAHLLKIDDEYVKALQEHKIKKERIYNMEDKKIIIIQPTGNGNKSMLNDSESIKYEYYSNYKTFREILTRDIQPEDYLQKFSEIEQLINFSKNYRNNFNHLLNNDDFQHIEEYNRESLDYYSNFIKSCKLLKEKQNNIYDKNLKNENSPYFSLYSELKIASDGKSYQLNEQTNLNHYVEIKDSLRNSYYKENFFNELYIHKNQVDKQHISNKFSEQIRMKIPVEYIDSIFQGRDNESFLKIDTFMAKYGKKPQVTNFKEKNLYENIYGLFSDKSSAYFLSYLYSKNKLFKYIFDEFAAEQNNHVSSFN